MSRQFSRDFLTEVAKGNIARHSIVDVVARNALVGTTIEDIWTIGGERVFLQADTAMEALSTSANDTSAGTGARTITVEGYTLAGTFVTQDVTMNGVTPVALGTNIRIPTKAFVKTAGAYATGTTAGGNAGNITIRTVSGSVSQAEILVENGVPEGISQTSHQVIPAGKTGYLLNLTISPETNKSVSILGITRPDFDLISAPFGAPRTFIRFDGIDAFKDVALPAPKNAFTEKSDIWFAGFTPTGTASISIEYQLLLVDN